MVFPENPINEKERLHYLNQLNIVNSLSDPSFDDITKMLSQICETPISLISFIDDEKLCVKSAQGIPIYDIPREVSFCAHAINSSDEIFIIEDARKDERFSANPFVVSTPNLIFYAAAPLITKEGYVLGTLSVMDYKPKNLNETQKDALIKLANQVLKLIELNFAKANLDNEKNKYKEIANLYEQTNKVAQIGWWELNLCSGLLNWSDITKEIHDVDFNYEPELGKAISFYKESKSRELIAAAVIDAIIYGTEADLNLEIISNKGIAKWVRVRFKAEITEDKASHQLHPNILAQLNKDQEIPVSKIYGTFQDITEHINKQTELQHMVDLTVSQNTRLQNFTHIISHNIRSHITNMSGVIHLVDKGIEESQEILVDVVRKSVAALEDTIQNLNEVISIQSNLNIPKKELVLKEEIEKILDVLKMNVEESKANIQINITPNKMIHTNPAYLESILQNLLTNAIKYRSPNRQLEIEISYQPFGKYNLLSVKDNGLGINLELYKDKIFGMYKTFHRNKDAKGLGLFITKTQVEAMKGKIEVESEVDKGSTFKVLFYEKD